MIKNKNISLLIGLSLIYFIGFATFLILLPKYFPVYCLWPLAAYGIYATIFHTEKIVMAAIFLTPFSVTLKELGVSEGHQSLDLSLPTEPIFAGLLLLGIIYQIHGNFVSGKVLKHPITVIILMQLVWILITSFTSEMPVVSIKFFIARLWFVCAGFFFASYLFKKRKNLELFFVLYMTSLCLVILYTTIGHALLGFDPEAATWVMTPFYNDHTAYGAAIAMFIPISIAYILRNERSKINKVLTTLSVMLLVFALYMSTARAAWVSVVAAVALLVTMLMRIKFGSLLVIVATAVILFFSFQTQILILMGNNTTDSEGHKSDNISSITNIKTDPSNVERLNRWSCAIRMFEERPVFGWGPGTYILQYAPFQKASEKTIISNNDGSNGNAHSEYLGPLSEQGLPGTVIVVLLLLSVFFTGYRLYYKIKERNLKILVAGIILGLATYFTHGFLNNFLDTDKLAIPFFGFLAALVCIDVYHKDGMEN